PALAQLADNPTLRRLTQLHLDDAGIRSGTQYGNLLRVDAGAMPRGQVRALLTSAHLNALTRLTLRLAGLGDAGSEEIVRSGILRRLERLDLRSCGITDVGAEILAACPDTARLKHLDVGANRLTQSGIARLLELDIRVQHDSQEGQFPPDLA